MPPREASFGSETVWVRDPDEVEDYFRQFPDLPSQLPGMIATVRAPFGDNAEVSVEMNRDAEVPDPFLVLMVRLPTYDGSVYDKLVVLWDQLESFPGFAEDRVFVTTDFSRPLFPHGV